MTELPNMYLETDEQRRFYEENGYLVIKGFLDIATINNLKERFIQICKGTVDKGKIIVVKEASLRDKGYTGEDLINKLHEIHNDEVFMTYTEHPRILSVVSQFVDTDLMVMNGMFINKPTGSVEHPPHQDLLYFPLRPAEKIIAAWTAVDEVTVENGCLYVVPKSHKQGVLYPHVSLTCASRMYHGITETITQEPRVNLEMSPGDTVFFHPLLVHGSGANLSGRHRKSIVVHYASEYCESIDTTGTVQEGVATEIEDFVRKRGVNIKFKDVLRFLSKSITVPPHLCPVSRL